MAGHFKVKDEVYVRSLGRMGVVLASPREGWYEVGVGKMRVLLPQSDLALRQGLSKKLLKSLKGLAAPTQKRPHTPSNKTPTLDLHGMRVEDAMRAVEKAMDRAILEGYERMEIVHGIGEGKIRAALHRYLSTLPTIENYRLDDRNPGVTWVYF